MDVAYTVSWEERSLWRGITASIWSTCSS